MKNLKISIVCFLALFINGPICYSTDLDSMDINALYLDLEIDDSIQEEAYLEYRNFSNDLSDLKSLVDIQLSEVANLKVEIQENSSTGSGVILKIDSKISQLEKSQFEAYNNLKNVLSRISSASSATNNLADTWISAISLSRGLENPFANSVVQNNWDKYANTLKWIPGLVLSGYSYISDQSSDAKTTSLAIGVSIPALIDIIQNLSKNDGVNSAQKVLENGSVAIDVISMYRTGYDDLNEILIFLESYKVFMKSESDSFEAWYKRLDANRALVMGEAELKTSEFWSDSIFTTAQVHFENIQKRLNYYYTIFNRVDLLITSRITNELFERYSLPNSPINNLKFKEGTPKMVTEFYDNLSELRKSLSSNKESWERLRKQYYTIRQSEYDAINSWIDLRGEISTLHLLRDSQ